MTNWEIAEEEARIESQVKVRRVLDEIDTVLEQGDRAAAQLWNVLSALRGPDDGDWLLKTQTTEPIRRTAFPKVAAKSDTLKGYSGIPADFYGKEFTRPIGSSHFAEHVRSAANALGLIKE